MKEEIEEALKIVGPGPALKYRRDRFVAPILILGLLGAAFVVCLCGAVRFVPMDGDILLSFAFVVGVWTGAMGTFGLAYLIASKLEQKRNVRLIARSKALMMIGPVTSKSGSPSTF